MPSDAVDRVLCQLIVGGFDPRGGEDRGWDAKCPAHDDRHPSLHVAEGRDGKALVTCHTGCTLAEIATALSLDVSDFFESELPPEKREVIERYDYCDEHGELLYQVERTRPKGFRQRRPDGNGGWDYKLGDVRRVIYRLPKVIEAVKAGTPICIVEGERDVHTLEAKGHVATTCPGGAGKWRDQYSAVFKNAQVAIIQDVDPPDPKTGKRAGQEHAQQVKESLQRHTARIKVLQPAVGKDVSDHVAAGLALSKLVPAAEVRRERLQVLSAPQVMRLPDPDTAGYLLGPLIYRGYRIVVGGHTGHGKTTMVMHMVACAVRGEDFIDPHWHGKGNLRVLIVDVEQGTKSVKRVLRETGLDANSNVSYLRVPDGLALDSDKDAIQFMEKTFAEGRYDICVADPLYKLHRADPNDSRAATDLMRRFDDWRERYNFALLLPMHCRKPHVGQPLSAHDLFGSSTYQWGAEVLLGIERPQDSDHYSLMHFWKDRDGELTEVAPLNGKWGLMFERGQGYRKAGKPKRVASHDVILDMLREHVDLSIREIEQMWPGGPLKAPKRDTIRNALAKIPGATHDGHVGKEAQRWQLPQTLLSTNV